eukprot:c15247_g1_i1 orf=105-356(-)
MVTESRKREKGKERNTAKALREIKASERGRAFVMQQGAEPIEGRKLEKEEGRKEGAGEQGRRLWKEQGGGGYRKKPAGKKDQK